MHTAKTTAAPIWAAYDDMAIWGTGATAAAAIADAAQWVNPEDAAKLQASCGTAIITTAPGGGIASVSVRAPDGPALVFERAARRCVLVAGAARTVRVEYRWEVAP